MNKWSLGKLLSVQIRKVYVLYVKMGSLFLFLSHRSRLYKSRGFSLISILISMGIMGFILTALFSMMNFQTQRLRSTRQELIKFSLRYSLLTTLGHHKNCLCQFDSLFIDTTATTQDLNLSHFKDGCGSHTAVTASPGKYLGYGLQVNTIKVKDIKETGAPNNYTGNLVISYQQGTLLPIQPLKIPVYVTIDPAGGSPYGRPINSCGTLGSSIRDTFAPCGGAPGGLHANGGGFVAHTATVANSAYVGVHAQVCQWAQVLDSARIMDLAKVLGAAKVYDSAEVENWATISGTAKVYGFAKVSNYAKVAHSSQVYDQARIYGSARVSGSAKVYNQAKIYDSSNVGGVVEVYDQAEVYGSSLANGAPKIYGYAKIYGLATVQRVSKIYGLAEVYGSARIYEGGRNL